MEELEELNRQFKNLKKNISIYNPKADFDLLDKAWEFAKLAHFEQKRLSGEPFVSHCLGIAEKLAEWKLDSISLAVGLLHDTLEHGVAKREDILKEFGSEILDLVEGVTRVSKLELKGSRDEVFVENLRKMFLAMAKDIRVVLIRLAERFHNMQTISYVPKENQKIIATETLEIYAPLAERLGMNQVKAELEDMCFECLYKEEYNKLLKESAIYYKKTDLILEKMKKTLLKNLYAHKIKAEIQSRKKHLYSLWKKLQRPEIAGDLEKVYDIVAMRILVENIPDCYTVLGILHDLYKPVGFLEISDFIANPKPNGYRSIHTRVIGPREKIVEVQIRTFEMHEECEFGIAAHWHLSLLKSKGKLTSEQIDKGLSSVNEKLSWVKELANWQKEIVDTEEFLRAVKFDALNERIFVFSPKGDVYDLPVGATPIDFAYAVHTELGNHIASAKVNGKMVSLDYKLNNGEVVEIIKSKSVRKPSPDWLNVVVTTQARQEIRRQLRKDIKVG